MSNFEKFNGKQVRMFRDALVAAFPSRSELAQMVRMYLDTPLDVIVREGNLATTAFELIEWAAANGALEHLVRGAISASPNNPTLRTFITTLEDIAQEGTHVNQTLVSSGSVPTATKFSRERERYVQRLRPRCDEWVGTKLGLVGSTVRTQRRVRAEGAYCPLACVRSGSPNENDRKIWSAQEVLNHKRPLIIRGPVGAGKTTWAYHLIRDLLNFSEVLPVLIEARTIAKAWAEATYPKSNKTLEYAIHETIVGTLPDGEAGWWKSFSTDKAERIVLVVDGWDEFGLVGDDFRLRLAEFRSAYPAVLVVATSRPYGSGRPTHADGFDVLDLCPLSHDQIRDLAERFGRTFHPDDPSWATSFIAALFAQEASLQLAQNPLLLTIMATVAEDGHLPTVRHRVFDKCIEHLLSVRPRDRLRSGEPPLADCWTPSTEERLRVVSALALRLREEPASVYGESLDRWSKSRVAACLEDNWPHDPPEDFTRREARTAFINWLTGPASIFNDYADGSISFVHKSLQDALIARTLIASARDAESRKSVLLQRFDTEWWETIRLWVGLLADESRTAADELIRDVANVVLSRSRDNEDFWLLGVLLLDVSGRQETIHGWTTSLARVLSQLPGQRGDAGYEAFVQAWHEAQTSPLRQQGSKDIVKSICNLDFFPWYRAQSRASVLKVGPMVPSTLLASRVNSAVDSRRNLDGLTLAAGKVLTGGFALWPGVEENIGLLNLWPSFRRVIALRLQLATVCGATRDDLSVILKNILPQAQPYMHRMPASGTLLADDVWRVDVGIGWRPFSPFSVEIDGEKTDGSPEGSTYYEFEWHEQDRLDQDSREDSMNSWLYRVAMVCPPTDHNYESWVWAHRLGLDRYWWAEEMGLVDIFSAGWYGARSALLSMKSPPTVEARLLRTAVACSIGAPIDGCLADVLGEVSSRVDDFWCILARCIARQAHPDDWTKLEAYAKCEIGVAGLHVDALKYFVRGDVLLQDGSEVLLDTLTRELGVQPIPYVAEYESEPKGG